MKYKECKTEQAFKYEWIKRHKGDYLKLFCIETEETVKGFPDVLGIRETEVMDKELNVIAKVQTPCFMEFKLAKRGRIKFQPTQPAFYKAHKELDILVVSLAEYYGKYYIVSFPVSALFEKNGAFELNGMNEVDLRSWLDLMQENGDEVQ